MFAVFFEIYARSGRLCGAERGAFEGVVCLNRGSELASFWRTFGTYT
jgi:hypothetical protein